MKQITDNELINELKQRLETGKNASVQTLYLTKQLNKVNKKLNESESLKSHFLSNIRNQIINPFASILALSSNILKLRADDRNRVNHMANLIHQEAFNLDFQLKNIFAAASLEAGESCPEPMYLDVNELIDEIVESFHQKAAQRDVNLIFKKSTDSNQKEGFYFFVDASKLRLIIFNLLDNAIKNSSAAGKIHIEATKKDDKLAVSVRDHGIGMAEHDISDIFDRFKRLDTSINSLHYGHGLGLAVVSALIDLLGGEIDVVSQKSVGSTFTITIPSSLTEAHTSKRISDEFLFENFSDSEEF